jgi:hypothetical protein
MKPVEATAAPTMMGLPSDDAEAESVDAGELEELLDELPQAASESAAAATTTVIGMERRPMDRPF